MANIEIDKGNFGKNCTYLESPGDVIGLPVLRIVSTTQQTAVTGEGFGVGVDGHAGAIGVVGRGLTGVWGEGATGVSGHGKWGVLGNGSNLGVLGHSDTTNGVGVQGYASATAGTSYGVIGESMSSSGIGVAGVSGNIGTATGVLGVTEPGGIPRVTPQLSGVHGAAVTGVGVIGESDSGIGVEGIATADSGETVGVFGGSNSDHGTGVEGHGADVGVFGKSDAEHGTGVEGHGPDSGVFGESDESRGTGVEGHATAEDGPTIGVYGQSDSTNGTGVQGNATATTGTSYGVIGESSSPDGVGVWAKNPTVTKTGPGQALKCTGHALPESDNTYNCGDATHRWALVRAQTVTSGDLIFENGVKATEDGDGLAFLNREGMWIAILDSKGNLRIRGKLIQGL